VTTSRSRRRWEDPRTDLEGIRWEGVDWIDLAHDRGKWRALVVMEMKLLIADNAGNILTR
jgi:hypothetical protein